MDNKNQIRLGRGHESDIRITDISVSRCHAFIKLDKGEFYIDDNNSKFGTLVHLKKAFNVPLDIPDVSLQVGRTVVSLTVKKSRRFLSGCFSSSTDNHNTSQDQRVSESEESSDSEMNEGDPENENEHENEGENENENNENEGVNEPQPNIEVAANNNANLAAVHQNPNVQANVQVAVISVNRVEDFEADDRSDENGNNRANENQNNADNLNALGLNLPEYNSRSDVDQNQLENLQMNASNQQNQSQNGDIQSNLVVENPEIRQVTDHFNDCDGPVD